MSSQNCYQAGLHLANFRESSRTMRAFDNAKRDAMGEVDRIFVVGTVEFKVIFQVIDILASFNLL